MNLWKIALRSVQYRRLASGLTALSISLGVALVVGVMVIHGVVDQSFKRSAQGYDLIVGAKGSRLELVLSTVYYLGKPIGKVPYDYYLELTEGRFAPEVDLAVPCCLGDNYEGYRVVGTTPDMFNELEYRGGEKYRFVEGENFGWGGYFDAVIGATAARKTGLKVGDTFQPGHGTTPEQGEKHKPFTIVGILAPTGTPNDRALFINIEGFWEIHSHGHYDEEQPAEGAPSEPATGSQVAAQATGERAAEKQGVEAGDQPGGTPSAGQGAAQPQAGDPHEQAGDAHADEAAHPERQVTAILVRTNTKRMTRAMALPKIINQEPDAQAVMPAEEITRLFEGIIGNIQAVLLVFAILIVIVAGIGMMVSIYNSMSERRHEIAVMRALGARRLTVMAIILLESILLSLGGGALGLILGHGLVGLLAPSIMENTGVVVSALQFQSIELVLIPGLIAMASVVGYLPAVIAYRTEVADSLSE